MIKIDEDKPNQLQKRLKIIAFSSLAVVIVLFIFLAWKAYNISEKLVVDNKTLEDNKKRITEQQEQISKNEEVKEQLDEDIAIKKDTIKQYEEVVDLYKKIASKDVTDKVVEDAPKNIVSEALEETPTAPQISSPRIYIQIREASQQKAAKELQKKLQEKGYIVPEIENVGGNPNPNSNLRYCKGKGQQSDVKVITELIFMEKRIKLSEQQISVKGCDKIKNTSYELWLEADFKN